MLFFPDDLTLSQTPEQKTCSTANTLPHTCDLRRDNKNSLIASLKGEQEASRAPGEELKPKADYKDYRSVGFGPRGVFSTVGLQLQSRCSEGFFCWGNKLLRGLVVFFGSRWPSGCARLMAFPLSLYPSRLYAAPSSKKKGT